MSLVDYIGPADILSAPNLAAAPQPHEGGDGLRRDGSLLGLRFVAALASHDHQSFEADSNSRHFLGTSSSRGAQRHNGASPHSSITRVPANLLRLGVPSSFTPGDAAARRESAKHIDADMHLNRSWKASSMLGNGASRNGVALSAASTSTSTTTPHTQQAAVRNATEARAQGFYRRMEVAAERELAIASIKSPTRNGMVVGKESNALQYAKVSLKEPGVATQRLSRLNARMYDHMLSETASAADALKRSHRIFNNPITAAHVALYQSASGPSATIASGHGMLSSSHVSQHEYNPYCPRTTEHIGRPPTSFVPAQPLVVAIPDGEDSLPNSPLKGSTGTLALATSASATATVQRSHETANVLNAIPEAPAAIQERCEEVEGGGECLLTPDDQAVLLHACRFVCGGSRHVRYYASSRDFHESVGVPQSAASKLLDQMDQERADWDSLQIGSLEHTIVLRLLERLLSHTTSWYLPSARLPSGTGSTSKLRVTELFHRLNGH